MYLVHLPFLLQFKDDMLAGRKRATSRTNKYGEVGDEFVAFGARFRFALVQKVELGWVAYHAHNKEGFRLPSEFIAVWEKIHPCAGYIAAQKVWYHEFERVKTVAQEEPA